MNMKQVEVFTDGSCLGNPGPGGYGALLRYGHHEKELSNGFFLTTNNRMEMIAVLNALTKITKTFLNEDVTIFSDSEW